MAGLNSRLLNFIPPAGLSLLHGTNLTPQSSLAAAIASGVSGDTLLVNGTFAAGGTAIVPPANFTVYGYGSNQSILTQTGSAAVFNLTSGGFRCINMGIVGSATGKAITYGASIDDVRIQDSYLFGGGDTFQRTSSAFAITNFRSYGCLYWGNFDGVYLGTGSNAIFSDCDFYMLSTGSNQANCFRILGSTLSLKSCRVRSTQNVTSGGCRGIKMEGATACTVDLWDTEFTLIQTDVTADSGDELDGIVMSASSVARLHQGCTFTQTTAGTSTLYDIDNTTAPGSVYIDPHTIGSNAGVLRVNGSLTGALGVLASDPHVVGQAYLLAGVQKISAG